MVCGNKEVASAILPFLKVYTDGSVERLLDSPFVPPSAEEDSAINVSSKDIRINSDVTARIYRPTYSPPPQQQQQRLPILAYFHGGGFIIESAFSFLSHRYITALVSQANIIVVSVEYRLAPENPLPIAYEDSWAALSWIAEHSNLVQNDAANKEPWLRNHGDFDRVFIGGDSAGANIAHNLSLRAKNEGIQIHGVILSHPYFLASNFGDDKSLLHKTWEFAYPNAPNGFDNPLINPFSNEAPSFSGLGCSRLIVCVAEKDELRERGIRYFNAVKKSEWKGKIELFEVEEEDHCFQIFDVDSEKAKIMIKRLALFLNNSSSQGILLQQCTNNV